MKAFVLTSLDPHLNLGFEQRLFEDCDEEYFLLWQNSQSVIIGKNQIAAEVVDLDFARENKIEVVRRMTGGGAVYHDCGNLNFSFLLNENISFGEVCRPILSALGALGLSCRLSGKNDIIANGFKVSGNARRLKNGRLLHHGTLLFDCDLAAMEQALAGGGKRSVETSTPGGVANILPMLAEPMSLDGFKTHILSFVDGGDTAELISPLDFYLAV